jgi:hypothetical protein
VGLNFQRGGFVFGGEALILTALGGGTFALGAMADVGFALGSTGRMLLYGTGGVLLAFSGGPPTPAFLVGGGAAFATGDRMSLFTEVLLQPGAGCCFIRMGANFGVR